MSTTVGARFDDDTIAELDRRAKAAGVTRTEIVAALVRETLDSVPVPPGLQVLELSTSQFASLGQTAERLGLTVMEAMQRFLKERIEREFIEERQRQVKPPKVYG